MLFVAAITTALVLEPFFLSLLAYKTSDIVYLALRIALLNILVLCYADFFIATVFLSVGQSKCVWPNAPQKHTIAGQCLHMWNP